MLTEGVSGDGRRAPRCAARTAATTAGSGLVELVFDAARTAGSVSAAGRTAAAAASNRAAVEPSEPRIGNATTSTAAADAGHRSAPKRTRNLSLRIGFSKNR